MSVSRTFKQTSNVSGEAVVRINGATANPTKANSASIIADKMVWARSGDIVTASYNYAQTDNTGAAAGTGNYLFGLPIPAKTSQDTIGSCFVLSDSSEVYGTVKLSDTNNCILFANSNVVSSANYDLATANDTQYEFTVTYIAA